MPGLGVMSGAALDALVGCHGNRLTDVAVWLRNLGCLASSTGSCSQLAAVYFFGLYVQQSNLAGPMLMAILIRKH